MRRDILFGKNLCAGYRIDTIGAPQGCQTVQKLSGGSLSDYLTNQELGLL
jgi:hypothetical protein